MSRFFWHSGIHHLQHKSKGLEHYLLGDSLQNIHFTTCFLLCFAAVLSYFIQVYQLDDSTSLLRKWSLKSIVMKPKRQPMMISFRGHNTESSQLALRAIPSLLDLKTGEDTETPSASSFSSPLLTSRTPSSRNAITISPPSKPQSKEGELIQRKKGSRDDGTEWRTATPEEEQTRMNVSALRYDVEGKSMNFSSEISWESCPVVC